jgi:hypothetical protein
MALDDWRKIKEENPVHFEKEREIKNHVGCV